MDPKEGDDFAISKDQLEETAASLPPAIPRLTNETPAPNSASTRNDTVDDEAGVAGAVEEEMIVPIVLPSMQLQRIESEPVSGSRVAESPFEHEEKESVGADIFVDEEQDTPKEEKKQEKTKRRGLFYGKLMSKEGAKGQEQVHEQHADGPAAVDGKKKKRRMFSNKLAPGVVAGAVGAHMAASNSKSKSELGSETLPAQPQNKEVRQSFFKRTKDGKKSKSEEPVHVEEEEQQQRDNESDDEKVRPAVNLTDIITILEPSPLASQTSRK